jgi:hypothetical protein
MIKYKTKIFFGTSSNCFYDNADEQFNKWIEEHPNIEILKFKYEQARYGDHSICILYQEVDNGE